MKKITTAIMVTAALTGAVSCKKDLIGDGPIVTQTRTVQNFSAIDLRMNGNVYYTQGATPKLEITAKESIHGILETTVIDNKLVIRYYNGKNYDNDGTISINVTAPDVSSFMLNTSGSIYCMNDFVTNNLYARATGSGDMDLSRIAARTASAYAEGSGDIKLKVSDHLDATIKGSGSIYFRGNPYISTHISGSGYLERF